MTKRGARAHGKPEVLVGSVLRIMHPRIGSGETVLAVAYGRTLTPARPNPPTVPVTLIDNPPVIVLGTCLRCEGRWRRDGQLGLTFRANRWSSMSSWTESVDEAARLDEIERFLATREVAEIGRRRAIRIVGKLGRRTEEAVARDPSLLASVRSISPRLADAIHRGWRDACAIAELREELAFVGFSPVVAERLHWTHGDAAADKIYDGCEQAKRDGRLKDINHYVYSCVYLDLAA